MTGERETLLVFNGGQVDQSRRLFSQDMKAFPEQAQKTCRFTDPIHIVHLVWSFDVGGMENGIVNLINAADPAHTRFSIFALTQLGSSQARIAAPHVGFAEFGKAPGNDWRVIQRLAQKLRQVQPDIVYTHGWGTYLEGTIAARFAGAPVLIHGEHGTTFFDKRRRVLAYRVLNRWTTRYTTVSASLSRVLQETVGIKPERITCIPNGVDTERFRPCPAARQRTRALLDFAETDYVVGAVGRLVPVKGFPLFVKAVQELAQAGIRARGVLIGDGPLRHELEALARNDSPPCPVLFLGNRSDVPDILQALDVYVSSSHSEGMSNTLLEAMATGLPVVATAVGGTVELVQPDETGMLIPANDLVNLTRALTTLWQSPELRMRLGQAGLRRCTEEFSLQQMVRRYEALYYACGPAQRSIVP